MSLKFGIYLVEQRIVTPEQFCGLIKIQQESAKALPTIALRKNLMTIRQVANVLDAIREAPGKAFQQVAIEMGYLHAKEADYLLQVQQTTAETIRALAVECGLLTERQAAVLYLHFQRNVSKQIAPAQPQPSSPQAASPQINEIQPSTAPPSTAPAKESARPKQPNFRRRPVIIEKQKANA